ncbi:hypothetical protein SAMN05421839_10575 [Halolactibacillus halophilus]|uniref:Uncharacterized protein n=1 Tax=Halolactibacillus halophilus TaxID=306540 RepID=A0A1I5MG60_9BACI|nr:hypothetical protein [Halolactibacillus halophilus]GEM02196.1 hypothetical protein HHA03_17280 [Halolactibacillus halophilus]SFP08572.1 hypothetical protein SAMN05421839_10575 [Halolactibacillus halophilus]
MYESFLTSLPALIGVFIGGTITFITQTMSDKRNEKLQEKERIENVRIRKLRVFGEIIRNESNSPLIYSDRQGAILEFDWKLYSDNNRNILYDNIELLNNEIIELILDMDFNYAKLNFLEEDEFGFITKSIYDDYSIILNMIKEEMNQIIK